MWRKWDLHVHTPASIVHNYPGEDPWDEFLSDLAALPPEISVIGINDYLFVNGYRRVLEEATAGNLPNIQAVFPVIELRIDQLVGTIGHLSKVNLHVLFEEETDPEIIEAQFINGLSASFRLDPGNPEVIAWTGYPSRDRLVEFGKAIRDSVDEQRRSEFHETDLELGFNNLVVALDGVRRRLEDPLFKDKAVLAVGKTEWASLPWGDASIATKKNVINGAHIVFVASESPSAYDAARSSLRTAGVNDRLLDCSDAHHLSSSGDKDRLGNCFTWIKADPTFAGLKHTLAEFEDRVFIGDEPPKLAAIRNRPGEHIGELSLRRIASPTNADHMYFDARLELNPGFVAIVGNKGKGKSALLDAIGLVTNSSNEDEFTFLSKDRFRHPQMNSAADYEVELVWLGGEKSSRRLDQHVPPGSLERASYLPQQLIDTICAAEPGPAADRFAKELGNVLFAHVPPSERLDATDLQSLIDLRNSAMEERLGVLRSDLKALNESVATLERRGKNDRRTALEGELADLGKKLVAVDATKPEVPEPPTEAPEASGLQEEIVQLKARVNELSATGQDLQKESADLAKRQDAGNRLKTAIATLVGRETAFKSDYSDEAAAVGVDLNELLKLDVDTKPLDQKLTEVGTRRGEINAFLDASTTGGIPAQLEELNGKIREAELRLDQPAREYAERLRRLQEWERARRDLVEGIPELRGIQQVESDLKEFDGIPARLEALQAVREDKVREVHDSLSEMVEIYRELYGPARKFIAEHELATTANLEFGASLRESNFESRFWDVVRRDVASTFLGVEEGSAQLRHLLEDVNFDDASDVVELTRRLVAALHSDMRSSVPVEVNPDLSIRKGHTLEEVYDLVFGLSYLEPYYLLQYSGTPIDRLSPGEKGTLLLMFYLLVDPSPSPLLLDQPDENLDNQTIKELLVPALKEAKERRQILVITHNPNVAVVADAEQVVVADFDGEQFSYASGALEDPAINAICVDVLEGTWPAFENREHKYQNPVLG